MNEIEGQETQPQESSEAPAPAAVQELELQGEPIEGTQEETQPTIEEQLDEIRATLGILTQAVQTLHERLEKIEQNDDAIALRARMQAAARVLEM